MISLLHVRHVSSEHVAKFADIFELDSYKYSSLFENRHNNDYTDTEDKFLMLLTDFKGKISNWVCLTAYIHYSVVIILTF